MGLAYRCLIAKFTLYVLVVFDNHMTTVGDSDWFCFVLQQDVITGWVDGLKKTQLDDMADKSEDKNCSTGVDLKFSLQCYGHIQNVRQFYL